MKKLFILSVTIILQSARLLLTFILAGGFTIVTAQPTIQWQNTIGGGGDDRLYSIQQTSDGGYILGGYSGSNISGDKTDSSHGNYDYWVVKLDTAGIIQWQNTIGGSSADYLRSIQQTSDGGYVLGGYSNSGISGDKTDTSRGSYDYWVVKLDASGTIQWQNTIGGSSADYLRSIQQTSDGGYILGGYSNSGISGDKTENSQGSSDYWVVKLDTSGVIQWQNSIGGSSGESLSSIQQTSDGGYVLGGWSWSNISGDKTENSLGNSDYWVVKLDTLGVIQWQNTIGGSSNDILLSIQQTSDGGYILGGRSESNISGDKTENSQGLYDYWVVKLDTSGTIQWQNTIGGTGWDFLFSIQQTSDEGYVLGGLSSSDISGDKTENSQGSNDYWVVKLDASGAIQWQRTIGGSGVDNFHSIQQTSDGGYILGGYSDSNISGDKTENSQGGDDYWVVKLCRSTTYTIQNICVGDSFQLPGGTYADAAGTYYDTLTNINGCDSIIATTLIVNPTYNTPATVTICNNDSILLQGVYQNTPGTYYDTLASVNGCDSVITTTLSVNPAYYITTADTICDNDSIFLQGSWQNTTGTYYDILLSVNSCDSVHSTVLIVNPLPTVDLSTDTTICNGCSIILNAGTGFASYNWSTGDTIQTITVDSAGAYSVMVTDANNCLGGDTIVINILIGINLQSSISNYQLEVFPNPNTGEFTVTFKIPVPSVAEGIEKQHINIKVFNIKGQVIYEENLKNFTPIASGQAGKYQNKIDMSGYAKGIYNLQLSTKKGIINKKIILE